MSERKIAYGRTSARDRAAITIKEAPWSDIVELFREPVRRKVKHENYLAWSPKDRAMDKNTGLFFGGRCSDGHRGDSNLVSRSVVNLDLDDDTEAIWKELTTTGTLAALKGMAFLLHTTRSHTADHPKLRILVPLARDIQPAEYEPVARGIAALLDPKMLAVARESYTPAQGMYFPSVSSDQEYVFLVGDGPFCDPDPLLVEYPADDSSRWPRREREIVTEYKPGRRMSHPEEKKSQAPIITATHRAFDPWTFIETFLSDIYIPSGERFFPVGATGAPSVRIYDDAFIQSDHGSDPAVGQHNSFDLGRIHLFRHLDDDFDISGMAPSEWPSFKAMADFMFSQPGIPELVREIEAEVATAKAREALDLLADLDDDEDDLLGSAGGGDDADDDLIGGPVATPTIEDVLLKVRNTIRNAESLDDLDRRLEKIRSISTSVFKVFHRDLVVDDLQAKLKELTDKSISKAVAKKMLSPALENLRKQMASEPIPDWLENWVFVSGENVMLNLITKARLNRDAFNGKFNKNTGEMFGSNELGVAKLSAFDAATQVFCVPVPDGLRYAPSQPDLFEDDGLLFANTYRAPVVPASAYKGSQGVTMLRRLVADLFPDKDHQNLLLDFLAHCIRYPGRKLRYALLVKGAEDEGKSLLGTLVGKLVGASNYGIVGTDQLTERFNGWSHQRVFVVIEEVKLPGQDAPLVLNKLKPVVSNHQVPIRRMQKDVTTEDNFCNLYLTTNYDDCLPLEEDNTRYLVLFTRFRANDDVKAWRAERVADEGFDYVSKLYDHINDHPHQFLTYFHERPFSKLYDPTGRAPWTIFKATMSDESKTEEMQFLEEMLLSGDNPAISKDVLIWKTLKDTFSSKGMGSRLIGRGVGAFMRDAGFSRINKTQRKGADGSLRHIRAWTQNTQLLTADGAALPELQEKIHEADQWLEAMEDIDSVRDLI